MLAQGNGILSRVGLSQLTDAMMEATYSVELSKPTRKRSTTTLLVCAEARPIKDAANKTTEDLYIVDEW